MSYICVHTVKHTNSPYTLIIKDLEYGLVIKVVNWAGDHSVQSGQTVTLTESFPLIDWETEKNRFQVMLKVPKSPQTQLIRDISHFITSHVVRPARLLEKLKFGLQTRCAAMWCHANKKQVKTMKRKYLGVYPVIKLINMNAILFYRWVLVCLLDFIFLHGLQYRTHTSIRNESREFSRTQMHRGTIPAES